ncbi:MAG: SufS family cysteine desulfurase [bacterium]
MTESMAVPDIAVSRARSNFDVAKIRQDFPILRQEVHGHPLVYLDNAASTQKPSIVIDTIKNYYERQHANIHRGVHHLSEMATNAYEEARLKIKNFIHADSVREIIFVRGTTEAINLVADSFGRNFIGQDDEIIISTMEHHSNIVPWQLFCERTGAKLRIAPINDRGELIFEEFENLLNEKTKLVAMVHVSNSLGTINPVKKIIERAHEFDVPVLLDGAQALSHLKVDVTDLDCDFYAFSAHKFFGPTGVGVLYGKEKYLEAMPPYQGGGDMIKSVTFTETTFNELPHKFEAGTPNIAGVVGFGQAIDYIENIGYDAIIAHETELLQYAERAVEQIDGVKLIGTARNKAGVISFVIDGVHPHDVGTILDRRGVAIRTGHHCTQPIMDRFNVPATSRASFALYNTQEEVEILIEAIHDVINLFK